MPTSSRDVSVVFRLPSPLRRTPGRYRCPSGTFRKSSGRGFSVQDDERTGEAGRASTRGSTGRQIHMMQEIEPGLHAKAPPAVGGQESFSHEAFVYATSGEFLAGTLPFLQEGLDAGEQVLAV